MAQRVSAAAPEPAAALPPVAAEQPEQGFLATHYGNPEKDEIYGTTANDYETEPEQIKDQKRSAGQAIWFLGAAVLLILLAYAWPQLM